MQTSLVTRSEGKHQKQLRKQLLFLFSLFSKTVSCDTITPKEMILCDY